MTIREAIEFELDNNFNVSPKEREAVLLNAASELDLTEDAVGSKIHFYEFVDEAIYDMLNN